MKSYFELRNISPGDYSDYVVPRWLLDEIGVANPNVRILDFGCGFGQNVSALKLQGYKRIEGADVDAAALSYCRSRGHLVHDVGVNEDFYEENRGQFDVIVTLHVLEHIAKENVIEVVGKLRRLLSSEGILIVAVPNAQAFTGCYWAYEDFTHHTLYTSGGIHYVLKAAGFEVVQFIDIDCTAGLGFFKKAQRRFSWCAYNFYYKSMCKLLASYTHISSPNIYSYEVKVVARNG